MTRHPTTLADPLDAALIVGASARLTRLITTDTAGEPFTDLVLDAAWRISPKARRLAAEGLDCPFCVGFHLSLVVTTSYALARRSPVLLSLWRVVAGALATNYLTGHLSARLDGIDDEEEPLPQEVSVQLHTGDPGPDGTDNVAKVSTSRVAFNIAPYTVHTDNEEPSP